MRCSTCLGGMEWLHCESVQCALFVMHHFAYCVVISLYMHVASLLFALILLKVISFKYFIQISWHEPFLFHHFTISVSITKMQDFCDYLKEKCIKHQWSEWLCMFCFMLKSHSRNLVSCIQTDCPQPVVCLQLQAAFILCNWKGLLFLSSFKFMWDMRFWELWWF